MVVSYPTTLVVGAILGTDTGIQLTYVGYAAVAVLVLGIDPIAPPVVFSTLALAFIIALEILAPRDGGLLSGAAMLGTFIASVIGTGTVMFAFMFYAVREVTRAEASAEFEHERSESLLANILPAAVANRLKSRADQVIADKHDEASILFADMVGFSAWAGATAPVDLVRFLNEVFTAFDRLVECHGLEKIKTTGDNYMVVSGVPASRSDHAAALVQLALEMLHAAQHIHDPHGREVSIRIGIASGPVVAGVVGMKKFFY
jgi:adenylate cyclase